MFYLSLDTETGGLGEETSLLSLGMVIANENFDILVEREWLLKPDDGLYLVEAKALSVNGINLIEHDKVAIKYKDAASDVYQFLFGHKDLVPVGKQVDGDIRRVQKNLLTKKTWSSLCSHRVVEVSSIFRFMKALGSFHRIENGSLKELAEAFGLKTEGLHGALFDAKLTLKVYELMLKLERNYRLDDENKSVGSY